MKTNFAIACLIVFCFGISGIPADAFYMSFNNYDRHHHGYWDRDDYYYAHRDWCRHHHRYCGPRYVVYNRFHRYDLDHNGYLSRHEVERIRDW